MSPRSARGFRRSPQRHDDRRFDGAVGCAERGDGRVRGYSGDAFDHAYGPFLEFDVVGDHVDHHAVVDMPQGDGHQGRHHVEGDFLSRSRPHARGPRQNLGRSFDANGDIGGLKERRVGIVGQRDDRRSAVARNVRGGQRVGRRSTGRDGDDRIGGRQLCQVGFKALRVVFGRPRHVGTRGQATRHVDAQLAGRYGKGPSKFLRIGGRHEPRRSGGDIVEGAATPDRRGHEIGGGSNFVKHVSSGLGSSDLALDQNMRDLARRPGVEPDGLCVHRLCSWRNHVIPPIPGYKIPF